MDVPAGGVASLAAASSASSSLLASGLPTLGSVPTNPLPIDHSLLYRSPKSYRAPMVTYEEDAPVAFVPSSTSPDGYLQTTEAGSLPLMRPHVGHALVHPPINHADARLPPAIIESFEIIGRAGGDSAENTCDSWIVRSKSNGKMAVFKPRDGEEFVQRKEFEEAEQARIEREERLKRARRPADQQLIAPASSSAPHPLSFSTSLRTPLKRGVVYGETTRKEVAAYLMDHDHFAGVPKTLEATIWLERTHAPNEGNNRHDSGIHNYHPYLHGPEHTLATQFALPAAASSPSRGLARSVSQTRLLLQATSNSPPMAPAASPPDSEALFQFDSDEAWLGPSAESAQSPPPASKSSQERHVSFASIDSSTTSPALKSQPVASNTTLLPPPNPFSPSSNASSPAISAHTSAFHSPEFVPSPAGSTPDEFRVLGLPAHDLVATYGSLQEFVENKGSAEDMGSASFPTDEVHRIGILDVRLLNLDRHLGNLLVQRDLQGKPHLVPIDHGFILPSVSDLRDVHLEWTYWRQCAEPFSKETLKYIARLDPIADAARLRNLGIRDEALVSMVFSSLLLKLAAAEGLTLFHIAQMVQRDGVGEEPSTLEIIVARVLGSQQAAYEAEYAASPTPSPDTPSNEATAGATDQQQRTYQFPPIDPTGEVILPSVAEESSPRSSSVSRCNSVPSRSPQASPGPFQSPPLTPHTGRQDSTTSTASPSRNQTPALPTAPNIQRTAGVESPPPSSMTLLTRSNSDGAMALAEAIIGRQQSAPSPTAASTGSLPAAAPTLQRSASEKSAPANEIAPALCERASSDRLKSPASRPRPMSSGRRQSVADAAKSIIALVDGANTSPAFGAGSPPFSPQLGSFNSTASAASPATAQVAPAMDPLSADPLHLPTPPPPSMLRLGTELTLYDQAMSAAAAAAAAAGDSTPAVGDVPTGAKLQHLLNLTEAVIREELAAYCEAKGLTPTPTHAAHQTQATSAQAESAAAKEAAPPSGDAAAAATPTINSCTVSTTGATHFNVSLHSPLTVTASPPVTPSYAATGGFPRASSSYALSALASPVSPTAALASLGFAIRRSPSQQRFSSGGGIGRSPSAEHINRSSFTITAES